MSDADTLRKAAARLRELVRRATPGPWRDGEHHGALVSDQPPPGGGRNYKGYYGGHLVGESLTSNDRAYIAAMNPLVGAALAELLDAAARDIDLGLGRHDAVMDVARALLGEADDE